MRYIDNAIGKERRQGKVGITVDILISVLDDIRDRVRDGEAIDGAISNATDRLIVGTNPTHNKNLLPSMFGGSETVDWSRK